MFLSFKMLKRDYSSELHNRASHLQEKKKVLTVLGSAKKQ